MSESPERRRTLDRCYARDFSGSIDFTSRAHLGAIQLNIAGIPVPVAKK
jgi:hypothetical protein